MAASIAHTMMGPGLGENGCVLRVNEKKINSIFWGFMKIVSKSYCSSWFMAIPSWGEMTVHVLSVQLPIVQAG